MRTTDEPNPVHEAMSEYAQSLYEQYRELVLYDFKLNFIPWHTRQDQMQGFASWLGSVADFIEEEYERQKNTR